MGREAGRRRPRRRGGEGVPDVDRASPRADLPEFLHSVGAVRRREPGFLRAWRRREGVELRHRRVLPAGGVREGQRRRRGASHFQEAAGAGLPRACMGGDGGEEDRVLDGDGGGAWGDARVVERGAGRVPGG